MDKEERRKILFPQKRGEPITPVVEELRKGTQEIADQSKEELYEGIVTGGTEQASKEKRETYAIAAYFLEKIHARIQPYPKGAETLTIYNAQAYPPEPHLKMQVTLSEMLEKDYLFASTADIRWVYPSQFLDAMAKWQEDIIAAPEDTYDKRAHKRLASLLRQPHMEAMRSPEGFLRRGAGTAADVSWSVLRAIPVAFYRAYNRTITKEEYQAIAEKAEPLIVLLSSLHLDSLRTLYRFTEDMGGLDNKSMNLEFPLEFFEIKEGKDGVKELSFDDHALLTFGTFHKVKGVGSYFNRFRCPALDAYTTGDDGSKENLVTNIYTQYRGYADTFIVPHLEQFTREALAQTQGLGEPEPAA